MPGLGKGFKIVFLTLTLTSVSFAGAGQTGQAPGKAKATLTSPAPRTAVVKRKAFVPTPQAGEEQAQLPSDQSQARAWLQDAARQEPVPDERTLRMQMQESKRLQQERDRNELKRKPPQALEAPGANDNRSVAESAPAKSLPAAITSLR